MAWNSNNINDLPLVLVGPVLRRVDKNSVTVWFALKRKVEGVCKLAVWSPFNNGSSHNSMIFPTQQTDWCRIGENLYILLITASGQDLDSEQLYFYNVCINGSWMIDGNGNPVDKVLVNDKYPSLSICYSDYKYPSFVTPPSEGNYHKIKIIHGSCRKPHGGEKDAMKIVDFLITKSAISIEELTSNRDLIGGLINRPQLLILTGDQIYADDVADTLLVMIQKSMDILIGKGEDGHYKDGQYKGCPNNGLPPAGQRQILLAPNKDEISNKEDDNKFTSSEAKSHLISLKEYIGMYLFVWSDVLWPSPEKFPTYKSIYNENEYIFVKYDKHLAVKEMNPTYKLYLEELQKINEFYEGLSIIRKIMANIPIFMIFDDHEITDDLFITQKWFHSNMEDVGDKIKITKRVIFNGFVAYSLFQDWGNRPFYYKGQCNWINQFNGIHNINTEEINKLIRLLLPQMFTNELKNNICDGVNEWQWSYFIDYHSFRLVCLDTRSQRQYYSEFGFPGLIRENIIDTQIAGSDNNSDDGFFKNHPVIIVSPAPVFGHVKIEGIQSATIDVKNKSLIQLMNTIDGEAWSLNDKNWQLFLKKVSYKYPLVIFLSGDVHYSFSNSIHYWGENKGQDFKGAPSSIFAQLCCSSLKNSDSKTNFAGANGWPIALTENFYYCFGYGTKKKIYYYDEVYCRDYLYILNEDPYTFNFELLRGIKISKPKWAYKFRFYQDVREDDCRGPFVPGSNKEERYIWDKLKGVVGVDNIGVVSFDRPESNKINIFHSMYYHLNDNDGKNLDPIFTEHKIDFNLNPEEGTDGEGITFKD